MELYGKILDDERVARAKQRFEKRSDPRGRRRKLAASFEMLLEYFANDCVSFADIAESNLTRERIRQIYNKYFKDLFPNKDTGRERGIACTLKRRDAIEKTVTQDLSKDEVFLRILQSASRAGCRVEGILKKDYCHLGLRARVLKVNGKQYAVRCSDIPCRSNNIPYSRVSVSRKTLIESAGTIILQKVEGEKYCILVVPSEDILQAFGRHKRESIDLSIPLEKKPTYSKMRGRPGRLDWREYENAWPKPQTLQQTQP